MSKFEIPELPYALDALEPNVSSETLQFHYNKHHAGYVNKLNGMVEGTKLEGSSLEDIIQNEDPGPVFNNAAQIWNHSFYWNSMTPDRAMKPGADIEEMIKKHFGSLEKFKQEFASVAAGQFGSGWAWLVKDGSDALKIVPTANAGTPLTDGLTPLLVCDVWEHAYYIDYRNDRPAYVEKFIELINWDFIKENYSR